MTAKRTFQIASVTKPGQRNAQTKFDSKKLFSGDPRNAAMKAMTHLCSADMKKIKGMCTFTVTMREMKKHMVDGKMQLSPVLDKSLIHKMYKYKLKRIKYSEVETAGPRVVEFGTKKDAIPFKYHVTVIESYGRVIPT